MDNVLSIKYHLRIPLDGIAIHHFGDGDVDSVWVSESFDVSEVAHLVAMQGCFVRLLT